MKKEILTNAIYIGADGRHSLYDLHIPEKHNGSLIIFIHGYMGFKDWGCWNLVAEFFTAQGYAFLKFNISHNGCTLEQADTFADLEAFSKNDYFKELSDLDKVISIVDVYKFDQLFLIGHSRGGGIALLQANNKAISGICTWAAIASIEKRFPTGEELEKWRVEGVRFVHNQRTQQQLPLSYDQYESYLKHKDRLNIEKACREQHLPICVIHGDKDEAVSLEEGKQIAQWTGTSIHIIKNSGHTFGSKHPWQDSELAIDLHEVCQISLDFFNQLSKKRSE